VYTARCISGGGRRKKMEVKMRRNASKYAPCGATKQFDQTFQKFDAWCESMAGRRDGEERSAEEGAI